MEASRLLKGVMDGAVDAGLVPRNPYAAKGRGTERTQEMRVATPEQVEALATAVGPRWEALIFTAACSGLRWGELAGLRRSDVDLATNTIRVRWKLSDVEGELSFGAPKTTAGVHTVGIPSFVARSLAVHIDLYALRTDDGLVFPTIEGEPMRRSNFRQRVWLPVTIEAGVEGLRFHDLRHTAATLAAASDASLRAVMNRIGHASPRASLRYQHLLDGQDADIVDYLKRFDNHPQVAASDRDAPPTKGTRRARNAVPDQPVVEQTSLDPDFLGWWSYLVISRTRQRLSASSVERR